MSSLPRNTPARPAPTALGPEIYGPWRASDVGTITDRLEQRQILDLVGEVAGNRILDIGCGDGGLAMQLSVRGARVVGLDASPSMIATAARRARDQGVDVAFSIGAADRLPFASDSFDLVVAVTILCFVEDARAEFREMARVLRPGGRLVIGELGRWNTWAAQRRIRGWCGSPVWRKARFRTAGELRGLAAGAGLAPEIVRGAIFYPRCRWAARLSAPWDAWLGHRTTAGAAFLALAASKPASPCPARPAGRDRAAL